MESKTIYLDSASTTKLDPRVLSEMLPYFTEYFGNASSNHDFGAIAKKSIEKARFQVAEIINCDSKEIIFTSGATESINLAIKGYVESNIDKGNHIITVKTEHKAVLSTCEYLETKGTEVTYLDIDRNGLISIEDLRDSVREDTILIVIMYVNNEIGVIQPIREIGEIARDNNVVFFCDATQAVGKVKVDVEEDLIDMLCFSGHKLNGPKGIGVLYKKKGIEITPLIHGGGQENGLRAGTYNTPLIIGLGKACEIAMNELKGNINKIKRLKEHLFKCLNETMPLLEISKDKFVVPHISNVMIPSLNTDVFIGKYNDLALSNGSACNSELIELSHVIRAMFPDANNEDGYLRISFDKFTSKEDIDFFVKLLSKSLNYKHA